MIPATVLFFYIPIVNRGLFYVLSTIFPRNGISIDIMVIIPIICPNSCTFIECEISLIAWTYGNVNHLLCSKVVPIDIPVAISRAFIIMSC
jgi:hypothetical protein